MGIFDDQAALCLAKDLCEPRHYCPARGDDVVEHVAGTYAGQLVHVAYQQQVAFRIDSFEQVIGQQQV